VSTVCAQIKAQRVRPLAAAVCRIRHTVSVGTCHVCKKQFSSWAIGKGVIVVGACDWRSPGKGLFIVCKGFGMSMQQEPLISAHCISAASMLVPTASIKLKHEGLASENGHTKCDCYCGKGGEWNLSMASCVRNDVARAACLQSIRLSSSTPNSSGSTVIQSMTTAWWWRLLLLCPGWIKARSACQYLYSYCTCVMCDISACMR
jgi:hypothetical protein